MECCGESGSLVSLVSWDAKYTPNCRPRQMNIMTHNSFPEANFPSQIRVNGSPSISRASSVEETNQA